jgi:cytochrome b6-f complex iron-sulfur subunit
MSTAVTIIIVVAVLVIAALAALLTFSRRSDVRGAGALSRETRQRDKSAPAPDLPEPPSGREVERLADAERRGELEPAKEFLPAPFVPPDAEAIAVSRRQFFNRATVTLMSVGIVTFAASAFVAFLWPTGTGGFGGQVTVGKLASIKDGIKQGGGFFYAAEARSWITAYPPEALPAAELVYPENVLVSMRQGIVVLSQKCPHLGCRVPECKTSQWFECQCHGSQYNRAGEKKAGPAPRGMDRFPATIGANGDVTIDTGKRVTGPAIGVNTTGQEAEGPHCTGGGEH